MEWMSHVDDEGGTIKIPERWLYIHYYEALNILFRFENSLRVFAYTILKNEHLQKWSECTFCVSGGKPSTIKATASKRASQAENFGYLGFNITAPMMHLTSGELVELITSDAYWPVFKSYFKGKREIIKNKLLEIGAIRNSVAHFRPIKPEDIDVIKQNTRHALLEVDSCLGNIFSQTLRVPTNTEDDWYKEISVLGTELVTTEMSYSSDEKWVKVALIYRTPILEKTQHSESFYSYKLAKINTPNILIEHPDLTPCLTYASENVNYPTFDNDFDVSVNKYINLIFSRRLLEDNYEIISREIKNVIRSITEETELLGQDSLARGRIVEPVASHSYWFEPKGGKGSWRHNYTELSQEYKPNHPDEYWGQQQYSTDVVAGCRRYPWMPEDISSIESLF